MNQNAGRQCLGVGHAFSPHNLLLPTQHWSSEKEGSGAPFVIDALHDPDLVSSMLTAIKDFVQDSFGAQKEDSLETLRVGERSVWIEQGPHAFLAAVIRGNPPRDYVTTLCETLEEIHINHKEQLQNFSGDSTPFNDTQYLLEKCLQAQFKGGDKKKLPSRLVYYSPRSWG